VDGEGAHYGNNRIIIFLLHNKQTNIDAIKSILQIIHSKKKGLSSLAIV
jgi:hypothetical protein